MRADSFTVAGGMPIIVAPGDAEATRIGRYLAALIGTSADTIAPRVVEASALASVSSGPAPAGSISLVIDATRAALGPEGYELIVTPERVTITAPRPAGLFYGTQTLRQLLPAAIEHEAARPRPVKVPAVRVVDQPRFAWRGAMLDVSRHFLDVGSVKRYIDLIALHKLNRLHLHLSDDQGWRIEIRSWPKLTERGGSTQVGGGAGGFYTQEEYADLVRYAEERYVTVVPEIDMPGHTNAALASYPELNCDGVARPLYTGIRVGFSALCAGKELTYTFIDDVVREIAALTPGEYFHMGGDEVEKLTGEEYRRFIQRAEGIVRSHGKRVIGWGEIAQAELDPSTIVQHWRRDSSHVAARRGSKVILSPASRVYLDMQYDSTTVPGLRWAGYSDVRKAYDWEPATLLAGVPESAILGVEAPLWSETLVTIRDFEFMAFPRLAGVAEMGWSPAAARNWEEYRRRLGAQAPRWAALGLNFHRAPEVPWRH
jgi:hexosaminidase